MTKDTVGDKFQTQLVNWRPLVQFVTKEVSPSWKNSRFFGSEFKIRVT